jgi:hypothetical protein
MERHARQRRFRADDLFVALIRTQRVGLDHRSGVGVGEIFGCEGDLVVRLKP